MDGSTLSALAAWAAAAVALTGVAFNFFVGRKQAKAALLSAENAGQHRIAEFRQAWINEIIDALSDHHSIASTIPPGQNPSPEDDRKLAALRTRLAIRLNPTEPDTVALLHAIERIDESRSDSEFDKAQAEMLSVARRLLKREWDRIKDELGNQEKRRR
jgi:hypothetical protein